MPQAIQFDGNGDAQFSVPFVENSLGISFYIKASTGNQTLFSSPQYLYNGNTWIGTWGVAIVLQDNGGIGTEYQYRLNGVVQTQCNWTFDAQIPLDGKTWHQVVLQTSDAFNTNCVLYIDGTSILPATQLASRNPNRLRHVPALNPPSPSPDGGLLQGKVVFGRDALNIQQMAPNFSGCITEIRMYNNSSFPILSGVPVDTNTPNLVYYWPMWVSSSSPLTDSVANQQLTLSEAVSVFTTSEAIYTDLLCEVIANTVPVNFDDFSVGNEMAAFNYLLQQAKYNGWTLGKWRTLYQQEGLNNALQDAYTDITVAKFPSGQAFSEQEFTTVKNTLLDELYGVNVAWGYYGTAETNLPFVANQFTAAASTVYTNAQTSATFKQASTTNSVKSDIGEIVGVLAHAAALIPDAGTYVSFAISYTWAVIGWISPASQDSPPGFTTALLIESTAPKLQSTANGIILSMTTKLQTSVALILGNYGLLKAAGDIVRNGGDFTFAISLNTDDQQKLNNLDAVYNFAINLFSQILVCAAFPAIGYWANQYGDYADDADQGTWNYEDPAWYSYNLTSMYIVGVNNGDTWTSLDTIYTNMINTAREYLSLDNVTWDEVFNNWPLVKSMHPPPNEGRIEERVERIS